MNVSVNAESAVGISRNAVRINGEPAILLSASLFYFRIPQPLWRERMEQVKAMGYNCIDVYFPWNFHEREEGSWDFSGDRDAETFLRTAAEVGLWVVARPGPYICSEWDGGALPAYLFVKPDMKLRDNDPVFLQYVSEWFGRILPVIARFQAGSGGSVISVQLDNELDFYDCADPRGYMEALRGMALAHGITVPLIACAGQGGLVQASGLVEGLVPTCNFYPDNRDPDFELKVSHYRQTLAAMEYPLLVTETNRSHYLLRRLLSGGAKLLGPYLQVSGTDFGFTNATNNWGKPLAFLTSDYDFAGMISPEGHVREEAYEGRLLGRLLAAYGASLAEAVPETAPSWLLSGAGSGASADAAGIFGPFALELEGGGKLLFVTNGGDEAREIVLASQDGRTTPSAGTMTLAGGRSLALPVDVPLSLWGLQGRLIQSTAELYLVEMRDGQTVLAFHAEEGTGEIVLEFGSPVEVDAAGAEIAQRDDRIVLKTKLTDTAACTFTMEDGRKLTIVVTDRAKALYLEEIASSGTITVSEPPRYAGRSEPAAQGWRLALLNPAAPPAQAGRVGAGHSRAEHLERLGVYRGFAWYEASAKVAAELTVQGVLIRSASDVVSLYADGRYAGTVVPGGGSAYIPLEPGTSAASLQARAEIWGHTNFDDARLPGLRLNALKGMTGMAAVTAVRDISANWSVYRAADRTFGGGAADVVAAELWPVVGFGGWLSPDHPSHEIYRRRFIASAEAASWTIQFQGIQSLARLHVNGRDAGEIHPFDPYVDITAYVTPGETVQLTVYLERVLGLPAGRVIVYEAVEAGDWTVSAAEESGLLAAAEAAGNGAAPQELPLALDPGAAAWLFGSALNSETGRGWRVRAAGSGLKLTVFFAERVVGRLWLPGGAGRPVMTGGSPDSFYLPGPWFPGGKGGLTILLEAVDPERPGRLESLDFIPV